MEFTYQTKGVCSHTIELKLDGNTVTSVRFLGGCPGNTEGLSALAAGSKAEDLIVKLRGIHCGGKSTSCPDQLARALEAWRDHQTKENLREE